MVRGPRGEIRRAKVLSTAALRGVVVLWQSGSATIALNTMPSTEVVESFFRGFLLRACRNASAPASCWSIRAARSAGAGRVELHLDASVDSTDPMTALAAGAIVDLVAPFEAPLLAVRLALNRPHPESLADCRICVGTTRGTNALLEGRVSSVTLFINEGLEDLLAIGDQRRLDIFATTPSKNPPLEKHAIGVPVRMAHDGREIQPLNEPLLRSRARAAHREGASIAAIALLHAGRSSIHEAQVARVLTDEGFSWITASHQCGSTSRFEPRARAAVVDAALSGPVGAFIRGVAKDACGAELLMMTSSGGLLPAAAFQPRESLLSGPAGGVAAAAAIARSCGFDRAVTLDMGGTSADVARVAGEPEIRDETSVGGAIIASPSIAVESVAAGGGSICWWDGEALRVGPRSAGASPGPACYGEGGPLTLTDAHLLLNRIDPKEMPIPLIVSRAEDRARALHAEIIESGTRSFTLESMLESFVDIATEAMANAIGTVTVRRGVDPADHALVCFGGAGGLHACAVAERLGIATVIIPADAGLLCASGISQAPITRILSKLLLSPLARAAALLPAEFAQLQRRGQEELGALGVDATTALVTRRLLMLRTQGQEESLEIDIGTDAHADNLPDVIENSFAERYRSVYGFSPAANRPIEVERIRLHIEASRTNRVAASPSASTIFADRSGPASIMRSDSTAFLPAGWTARAHACGAIVMTIDSRGATPTRRSLSSHEIIAAHMSAIATDMGEQLRRTSVSPNIKDRLDFSCGILDSTGFLVVNAPHIPIHLGALGACVRAVIAHRAVNPGDVIVVNHPHFGGSHLPDLTVITPIFSTAADLLGFAANRAHHAEVGGTRPGSMPPDATTLAQEGVVIAPTLLVEGGRACFDRVETLLRSGAWPSRLVEDNLADLRAQVAANELAAARMRGLFVQHGEEAVRSCAVTLRTAARRASERALRARPDSSGAMEERLDDGTLLVLEVRRSRHPDRLTFDLSGSAGQHHGNLNAPAAVTRAAVMYAIRALVGLDLGSDGPAFPMNEGLLDPVEIILPDRTILSPDFSAAPEACPACAIGQTETSQRLVDLLWRALDLAACSQGTVNNLLFGNDAFGFYETIGGGAGASQRGSGASGLHTHISNTRITDAEVLERRYPVRLERFAIRKGSGGAGLHRGGDGLIRRLLFLEPVELSFLSQHRVEAPYGLHGGLPGARGGQRIIRAGRVPEEVAGIVALQVAAGDAFEIATPGGGGFGPAPI